jgi:Tol biopolymer transport system component/predicted Ser/Thr protein kinase
MIGKTTAHYKILEKLGEGGMGVVYKALDTKLERFVALKFLPPHISITAEDTARFLQEARAASAISHPNVCVIHDIVEHDDHHFIVMEYVDGKTLRQLVPVQKTQDALTYAIQIGEALQEAHSRGVVHRDIKAENVMVDSKNMVKVMDFGLAKLRGSLKLTRTSSTVGTLAYMAPEQIQGGDVDARSDIFSFGVVLYELLTGHLPFVGEHEAAVMYSILNDSPLPIQKFKPDLSSELLHIINRALEKDPEERYQTVHDMVIDLRRAKKEMSRVSRPAFTPPAAEVEQTVVPRGQSAVVGQRVPVEQGERTAGKRQPLRRAFLWAGLAGLIVVIAAIAVVLPLRKHTPRLNPKMSFRTLDVPFTEIDFAGLSRDGSWVVFSARDAKQEWSIYFMNVVKGEPRRLVTDPYERFDYTEISPDNSEVLFGAGGSGKGFHSAICVVSSQGGTSRKIAEPGIGCRWRPDGRLIGYIRDGSPGAPSQSGKFEFWTVKPDGSENRLVFVDSLCYLWSNYCFDWSPQGDRIAWLRSFPDYGEIFIRDLESGREYQLTHYRKPITEMAWASNDQIFFTSSRSGNTNVWMVPAKGGEAIQVTKGSGPDYAVRVSADATRLLYVEQRRITDIWTADIDGRNVRQLTFDNQRLDEPMFSPDKKRITFTMFSSDILRPNAHVFTMQSDGTNRTQLTHGEGLYFGSVWSPDGKYMTYGSKRIDEPHDSSRVYLIETSNPGTPRLVGRGVFAFWIDAERFVTITALPHSYSTLYTVKASEPIEAAQDSTRRFPLRDGKHVLLGDMRKGHEGWWLKSAGAGEEEVVRQVLASEYCDRACPSVSLRYLLYQEPSGELWRMSLPEGKRERMAATFDRINPNMGGIQLSFDDKSVVYGRGRLDARLVLIENLFE